MISKDVRYISKDFDSFKSDLISFVKQYYPNEYKDFNESSTGMMLLELTAYIGDVLSFYLDKQFREIFPSTATETQNLIDRSENLGYLVRGNKASQGKLQFFCEVSSSRTSDGNFIPLLSEAPIVLANTECSDESSVSIRLVEDIDFSDSKDLQYAVLDTDNSGNPVSFALKKEGAAEAGELKETTFYVGQIGMDAGNNQIVIPEEGIHLSVPINDTEVIAIDDVIDSAGNRWYEVPFLAQDTIYKMESNAGPNDRDLVPQTLCVQRVPRRFITRYDKDGKINLIFGNGTENLLAESLIPNPTDLAIPLRGRDVFTSIIINPENFVKTNTMGIFPQSTTLTITYVKGGGNISNIPAGSIKNVKNLLVNFPAGTADATKNRIISTVAVTNETRFVGGEDAFNKDRIRQDSSLYFASQGRGVTQDDISVIAMTMPSKLGQVFRSYATNGDGHNATVHLYITSRDNKDNLIKPSLTLKQNLQTYLRRYRMLTDQIEILDANIYDIGIDFTIVTRLRDNKKKVVSDCLVSLKEFFSIDKWQIGQAIIISEIYELLQNIEGVLSVSDISVVNLSGLNRTTNLSYSDDVIDILDNTKLGIISPSSNGIFHVRYPDRDLRGSPQ